MPRFKKGSIEAKRYMAKIRNKKTTTKKTVAKKVSGTVGAIPISLETFASSRNLRVVELRFGHRSSGAKQKGYALIDSDKNEIVTIEPSFSSTNKWRAYVRKIGENRDYYISGKTISDIIKHMKSDKNIGPGWTGYKYSGIGSVTTKKATAKKPNQSKSIHKDSKSHNVNIRVVSGVKKSKGIFGIPGYSDPAIARELELYAMNDFLLYTNRRIPIIKNLERKYKKGTFDVKKASKLWRYFVDASLQKYHREFGSKTTPWHKMMSVADRNLLSMELAIETKREFDNGNFE